MNAPAYIPRRGSLPERVLSFFLNNPTEQLTAGDIAQKFSVRQGNVHYQLMQALQRGLLRRHHNEDLELAYSIGPNARLCELNKAPAEAEEPCQAEPDSEVDESTPISPFATLGSQRQAKAQGRNKRFALDLSRIQIEKGVPIPVLRGQPTAWPRVLQRLQPGDSFALPAQARSSIQKAATRWKQATGVQIVIRKTDEGIRVWRAPA